MARAIPNPYSSAALHNLFQLRRHLRQRLARHAEFPSFALPHDAVHLAPFLVVVREIFARVAAAAFRPLERRLRHRFADVEHVLQIERQVPARIVLNVAADFGLGRPRPQLGDLVERRSQIFVRAHDADQALHRGPQIFVNRVRILTLPVAETLAAPRPPRARLHPD